MENPRGQPALGDRILLVEADPLVNDVIGRQVLQALGYQVQVATDAASAISRALQWAPDLIMIDLDLPGLSGKDLIVAFASQGIQAPLIILAKRGTEADIIQTFRLGAADYLLLPVREAEVVNVVNRVMQQVHDRRERDRLAQQLQQTNQEMQSRVRELTTIFAVGKAMTSITDQVYLLEKILDAAIRSVQADLGWFLLREDNKKPFVIVTERNLPTSLGVRLNQPWDDGISSLVAMSGERLSIHGDPLRRFRISSLGQSVLVIPIKAQKTVIGLLVLVRKAPAPFKLEEQHLLEAMADYASISLINARLFRALEERARFSQQMAETSLLVEKVNLDILRQVKEEVSRSSASALGTLEQMGKDVTARWRPDQRKQLNAVQNHLIHTGQVASAISPQQIPKGPGEPARVDLGKSAVQSAQRMQGFASSAGLALSAQNPSEPVAVFGDAGLIAQALDGLVGYVIRHSKPGGKIMLRIEKQPDRQVLLRVIGTSFQLEPKDAQTVFDDKNESTGGGPFSGLGIRLNLVKEIVTRHNGSICLPPPESKEPGFQVRFPGEVGS